MSGEIRVGFPLFLLIPWTMAQDTIKAGKKAGIVTYQVGDTLLAREYNPHPKNPRTKLQVIQRSKIKFVSQLCAIFRFFLAIYTDYEHGVRAYFQKYLYSLIIDEDEDFNTHLRHIQLTNGFDVLGSLQRGSISLEGKIYTYFAIVSTPPEDISRVLYFLFKRTELGGLTFVNYHNADERGPIDNYFYYRWISEDVHRTLDGGADTDYYCYAFGMRDLSARATAIWNDMTEEQQLNIAELIKIGKVNPSRYTFTRSICLHIQIGT